MRVDYRGEQKSEQVWRSEEESLERAAPIVDWKRTRWRFSILPVSKNSTISHHLNDDRLAFLEAVRTASLLPDNGSAPTRKMYDAIFHILFDVDSLELLVESFQLLVDLDKRFPPVYLSKGEEAESSSASKITSQLVMVEEAWFPFNFGVENHNEKGHYEKGPNNSRSSLDSTDFHALIEEVARLAKKVEKQAVDIKSLKNMLLLRYLITVLEGDFLPRNCSYQQNMNWIPLRESHLNMLLGSRKIMYKSLMKDCLSLMCDLSQSACRGIKYLENPSAQLELALREVEKSTCTVLNKLLLMIIELDSSRRSADEKGLTNRADGVRTPIMDIIIDELIYNDNIRFSFLQVFDEKWKLEIIVQYFQKYIPKRSVQTRRSFGSDSTESFNDVLKYMSSRSSVRSIIRKIDFEVVQLLMAHAFQAYVALSLKSSCVVSSSAMEDGQCSPSLVVVCKSIISAFKCIKQEHPEVEILNFAKESTNYSCCHPFDNCMSFYSLSVEPMQPIEMHEHLFFW